MELPTRNLVDTSKEEDGDDTENISQDDLIKQGIEQLKILGGGELTKTDERKLKVNQIRKFMTTYEGEKLILMRSKVNEQYNICFWKTISREYLTGNRLDEYLEPVPRNYYLEASTVMMVCLMKLKDLWS